MRAVEKKRLAFAQNQFAYREQLWGDLLQSVNEHGLEGWRMDGWSVETGGIAP